MSFSVKICLYLFTALILSGCGTISTYQPPTAGPAAYIAFVPTMELQNTSITIYQNGDICLNPQILSSSVIKNQQWIKITANKETAFNLIWDNSNYTCKMLFSFLPAENQRYLLYFVVKGNVCRVAMGKIGNDNHSLTRIKVNTRTSYFLNLSNTGGYCKPLN